MLGHIHRRRTASLIAATAAALAATGASADYRLTILHNNDGESQLINAGSGELENYGGIARFGTLVNQLRGEGEAEGAVAVLSSGDNFLAGPEWNASLERGVPFYDSIALDLIDYDAFALGNHEFDFNPDVLCEFIAGFEVFPAGPTKFLSANLDFSDEPCLQFASDANRVGGARIIEKGGERIGIVGATTTDLGSISTPRDVIVNDVLPAVQGHVNGLLRLGVDKIVLISHLQSIDEELSLLAQLSGVDVVIAGGGDELLGEEGVPVVPGDDEDGFSGPYPLIAQDADGNDVPVVTTPGNYKYVGRLVVDFDDDGVITNIDGKSGLVRVSGNPEDADAVEANPVLQALVVDPVAQALEDLAATVIATSEVGLDGIRGNIRTQETNLGNLIADAFLQQATALAPSFGAPVPDVALANGGGIRNDDIRGPGNITALDTFDILPFSNILTVVPNIPREQFKDILENCVSAVESTSGRFAQVAGFSFSWDPAATPSDIVDGEIVVEGQRVVDVILDDGTVIVENGAVVPGDAIDIAIVDFLARGGDEYPFDGAPFTNLGVSYQQALRNFIEDSLSGSITAADYPEGGEGRIVELAP